MKNKFLILIILVTAPVFGTGKHDLSTITGKDIDLKTYDHAFAGSIKDFVVWGSFDESTYSSQLIARKYGQLIKVEFKRDGKRFGGSVSYQVKGKKREHSVYIKGIEPKSRRITLLLDGNPVEVKITSDSFDRKTMHFQNPSYSFAVDGKEVVFKLNNGDACFGVSAHYSMLILMAWVI